MAPHSKRSSASDLVCEANTKHKVWIRRCAAGSAPAVSPIVHARSAQVGIGERESRRGWGQQLVVRGQLHSPMVKLVMRVAHVAPIRARCFNSKRTSFHVALELEHVESVDLRSAIRKADAVLPAFARAGQRGDTLSASRGEAGVVCCFDSGCNTSSTRTHTGNVCVLGIYCGFLNKLLTQKKRSAQPGTDSHLVHQLTKQSKP